MQTSGRVDLMDAHTSYIILVLDGREEEDEVGSWQGTGTCENALEYQMSGHKCATLVCRVANPCCE